MCKIVHACKYAVVQIFGDFDNHFPGSLPLCNAQLSSLSLSLSLSLSILQVLSAKVVAKAQSKARFGYVTMGTRDQAQKCISQLNGTELKGNIIHVELVCCQTLCLPMCVYNVMHSHSNMWWC